jgi:hypothetical protein
MFFKLAGLGTTAALGAPLVRGAEAVAAKPGCVGEPARERRVKRKGTAKLGGRHKEDLAADDYCCRRPGLRLSALSAPYLPCQSVFIRG